MNSTASVLLKNDEMASSQGPRCPQLLVGLFPDRNVQLAIERHRQQWLWPRTSRFPPIDRLHLTLGYVEDHAQARCAQRLIDALSDVRMQSLELLLDYAGTWSNDVSVVQPAPHNGLRKLRQTIWRVIRKAGLTDQAPLAGWTPHITIARESEGAACPTMSPIPWAVNEIRLVRSHFTVPFRHEGLASISAQEGMRILARPRAAPPAWH